MKLSVVTVTYNNELTIDDYLTSVLKSLPKDSEVIFIDSGSSDGTVSYITNRISATGAKIKLVEVGKNIGFGAGCNLGAKKALGEVLFFLNPDTKVLDDSISKLLNLLKSNQNFGIVAPKLLEDNDRVQPSVRKLPTIFGAVKEYYFGVKNSYEPFAPSGFDPIDVESVVGAAIMIRKKLFESLRGFDSKFFMYFEDLDLCKRVRDDGFKIMYDPKIEIYHKIGASSNEQKRVWIKESSKKYHGFFAELILDLILRLRPKNGNS